MRILKILILLMANFQVFQTIYHTNFCISTGIKTTANFLIADIETASFIARDCSSSGAAKEGKVRDGDRRQTEGQTDRFPRQILF